MVFILTVVFVALVCYFVFSLVSDYMRDKVRARRLDCLMDKHIDRQVAHLSDGLYRFHPKRWSSVFNSPKEAPIVQFYIDEVYNADTHSIESRMVMRCTHLYPTLYDFHSVAVQVGDRFYHMPYDLTHISKSESSAFNYAEVYGDVVYTLACEILRSARSATRFVVIGADFKRKYTLTSADKEAIEALVDFYDLINEQ